MSVDFSRRSTQAELMDTETVTGSDFAACLADLSVVNTLTLARPPTIGFLRRAARGRRHLSVLDVGFGHGDMLRRLGRWGARRGMALDLAGIDLNPWSEPAAREADPAAHVQYRTGDVFAEPPGRYDVIISSLFTHHLDDAGVVRFLAWMERTARRGWFINDLHRHKLAYYGFAALSRAAGWHRFVQHDGPVSVARSFRREDWARLLRQAGLEDVARVRWHMPFRYCVSRLR